MMRLLALTLFVCGSLGFSARAFAGDPEDEFAYRTQVEAEAKVWAEELMFMYKWSAKYPSNWLGMRDRPLEDGAVQKRLRSELAWLTMTGHGLISTFDPGADTTLVGSTSRLTSALLVSKSFWTEVRKQCVDIRELQLANAKEKGLAFTPEPLGACAERFRHDLSITQIIGSNVSLFVGTGVVFSIGKRLYMRYAAKWVTARIVPFLPIALRSKWVIGGTMAAIVIVPTAFVLGGVSHEREQSLTYFEDLVRSLEEKRNEDPRESIIKAKALKTERQVLEFALWVHQRAPETGDADASRQFAFEAQMYGPHYSVLKSKRDELISRRASLEASLAAVPGVTARLRSIAAARSAGGKLSEDDMRLYREAQYLASLRMTLLFL